MPEPRPPGPPSPPGPLPEAGGAQGTESCPRRPALSGMPQAPAEPRAQETPVGGSRSPELAGRSGRGHGGGCERKLQARAVGGETGGNPVRGRPGEEGEGSSGIKALPSGKWS